MSGKVFGFDESALSMQRLSQGAKRARDKQREIGDDMQQRAEQIFQNKLKQHTGDGAKGIISEHSGDTSKIGWASRPGFHGYFHERGFHALDNRRGGRKLQRKSAKDGRFRVYKGVPWTYVPPSPHMLPASKELEQKYYSEVKKSLKK